VKKFLIIQTAFIGDVILATPVLSEIKRLFPDSQIDFLLRKGNESLLENNPKLNKVLIFDKKNNKLKNLFTLIKKIRKEKYDEVINLHRFASTGIITAFSGAKNKVGFDKNPLSFLYNIQVKHELSNSKHEVERNLSCLNHLGEIKFTRPEIFPSENDFNEVSPYISENYFCLAPASVWFTKQLPFEKWIELAKKLASKGKVYLIGGPNDFELCESIKSKSNLENCFNFAGKFTFLQSASLLKNAQMNYVNDSGPLHFCSAMNAPVTVYFCSTSPDFGFGPLSDKSIIVESEIKPKCKPCGIHGFKVCPKGEFVCGNEIKIEA
jgi:ADP-heptose:LPS heptosyltransferase